MSNWAFLVVIAGMTIGLGACSEPDEITGEAAHTPVAARLYADGVELTPTVSIARGVTNRIEVRFFAQSGDRITGIEPDHFTRLTFNAASLASATDDPTQRFFKYVVTQASAGATGTVTVGYGHRASADEQTFGPYAVTIR